MFWAFRIMVGVGVLMLAVAWTAHGSSGAGASPARWRCARWW
ncbi:MAG: hypothetical protein QM739_06250 [Propionivibrio sp.]